LPDYSYSKQFTAGTDETSQEELEMPCHWGTITRLRIHFPNGCHGVCHVHIDQELHQVYPTNPEGDYALNGVTVVIDDRYKIPKDVRKLCLKGYNLGQYPHTISVSFTVESDYIPNPAEQAIMNIYNLLKRIFGWRG
jgi:hypothetical protein